MAGQRATRLQNDAGTRTRLLDAAVIEFADRGFEKATIRAICGRASVNLNAVKYHFRDKMGLYKAALQHSRSCLRNHRSDELMTEGSPEERLRDFVEEMLTMALSDEHQSSPQELLMLREMTSPTQALEEIAQTFVKPRFQALDGIMRQLLPPNTPTIDRHLMCMSVVGQCMHFKFGRRFDRLFIAKSEYRRYTVPRLTEHIMGVLRAAIDSCWSQSSVEQKAGERELSS